MLEHIILYFTKGFGKKTTTLFYSVDINIYRYVCFGIVKAAFKRHGTGVMPKINFKCLSAFEFLLWCTIYASVELI